MTSIDLDLDLDLDLDFAKRSSSDEWMDTQSVAFEDFRACLRDLARVNALTLASRPTLHFLDQLMATVRRPDRPIEIVDVGSGYGDSLRKIHLWAERRGVPVSLTGVDLNPGSSRAAAEATAPHQRIRWVTADAFTYRPDRAIDVIVSSLFTHHLTDPLIVKFIAWMESNARLGWFINDLHRSKVSYHLFRSFSKLARFHRFVQHDGPVSIARGFSAAEWERMLADASLASGTAKVEWRMPFRITVTRIKDS